jgi:hypothetical protein
VKHLRRALGVQHVFGGFVFDGGEDYFHPFAGADDREVGFFGEVGVLENFVANALEDLEAPQPIEFFEDGSVSRLHGDKEFFVNFVELFEFGFVDFEERGSDWQNYSKFLGTS